jgi:starvation-inducible outer membrane lipoprotein
MIEESVYKLTEKQFAEIKCWESAVKENYKLEDDYEDFLYKKKGYYKYIGEIEGVFRS